MRRRLGGWLRRRPACLHRLRGASTGGSAFVPGFMHGFDAKLDCLVFGERVALLYAAQGFAAEGHLRHRLKQLAVAHLRATRMQTIKQLAVELDSLGWRCGHAGMVALRRAASTPRRVWADRRNVGRTPPATCAGHLRAPRSRRRRYPPRASGAARETPAGSHCAQRQVLSAVGTRRHGTRFPNRLGTSAQSAENRPQTAAIWRLRKSGEARASFRLGMRVWGHFSGRLRRASHGRGRWFEPSRAHRTHRLDQSTKVSSLQAARASIAAGRRSP